MQLMLAVRKPRPCALLATAFRALVAKFRVVAESCSSLLPAAARPTD